jgi:hypothetical protein
MLEILLEEEESNVCMACGSHWEVRGLFQKPHQFNQRGFYPSHSNFAKAAFPKVTAHNNFFQSHNPTKHTLSPPCGKGKEKPGNMLCPYNPST